MGLKMVTGEKAEPTPIPGKRGSIPVTVESTHDDANLYLRFTWPNGDHTPVPFVEGGKMDPENPMKLAFMLATDDVEYADRSGCWATCHHDARSMPHAPEQATADASETAARIDVSSGITKYLKESRTKVEVKGKRGKKRGGWDKLKEATEIDALLQEGKFIDVVRYQSGDGRVESGHILAQRSMETGGATEFEAQLGDDNVWSVTVKRPLATDRPGNLSLAPDAIYNFGFAIHDDYTNARFHHVSLGYKLGFDNPDAEINATAQ